MQQLLNLYCQLFGYASCAAMSMLETLVLFGLLLLAVPISLLLAGLLAYGLGAVIGAVGVFIWALFHPRFWWPKRK